MKTRKINDDPVEEMAILWKNREKRDKEKGTAGVANACVGCATAARMVGMRYSAAIIAAHVQPRAGRRVKSRENRKE